MDWSSAADGMVSSPQEKHFVDVHRNDLIQRVYNIGPIMDQLRDVVLQPEQYTRVMGITPKQDQIRFLFEGPLTAGGEGSKDVFLSVLEREEKGLIEDLRRKDRGGNLC